jgi:hypothetical protein
MSQTAAGKKTFLKWNPRVQHHDAQKKKLKTVRTAFGTEH